MATRDCLEIGNSIIVHNTDSFWNKTWVITSVTWFFQNLWFIQGQNEWVIDSFTELIWSKPLNKSETRILCCSKTECFDFICMLVGKERLKFVSNLNLVFKSRTLSLLMFCFLLNCKAVSHLQLSQDLAFRTTVLLFKRNCINIPSKMLYYMQNCSKYVGDGSKKVVTTFFQKESLACFHMTKRSIFNVLHC